VSDLRKQLLVALERRHRHGGPERGLCEREIEGCVDVIAFANETVVVAHVHLHVRVACAGPGRSRVAFAGQPDPLAVVDAGRDLDL